MHLYQPARVKAIRQKSWDMQIAAGGNPEDRSLWRQACHDSRQQAGGKAGGHRTGLRLDPGSSDLMQIAECHTSFSKTCIDPRVGERQHSVGGARLKRFQLSMQRRQQDKIRSVHRSVHDRVFVFCSNILFPV
jgi:hypothetical protein